MAFTRGDILPGRRSCLQCCVLLCSGESAAPVGFSHFSTSRASASRCASLGLSAEQELGLLLPTPLLPVRFVLWCTDVHTRVHAHRAPSVFPPLNPAGVFSQGRRAPVQLRSAPVPLVPFTLPGEDEASLRGPEGASLPSSAWQEPWLRDVAHPEPAPRGARAGIRTPGEGVAEALKFLTVC